MACADKSDLLSFLTDMSGKHLFDAIFCSYAGTHGPLSGIVFTLFVYGTLFGMYFAADRSTVVPLVLSIMTAGLIGTALPAGAVQVFVVLFMFGVPTAIMWLVHRSRSTP